MRKSIKQILAFVSSAAMVASMITVPVTANAEDFTPIFSGDTVTKEWKFDFGAEGATPEAGFTLVTPDTYYNHSDASSEYGFLGINENDYKLGDRYDGFGTQQGQVIELKAGGGTGASDAIGSTGADVYENAGDVYYPTRFALRAEDDHYYRVRATVTTLDPSKDAEISLYTERKHPLFTDTKVAAGTTKTVEFSVRPTPIYYQKSNPTGVIADGMVNVAVLGTNSALASLEIQEVQAYPVFWVLGDSTVTDGNCSLPFFRLQNFTGVGTGLTKYLPRNMAMVNEGEGGLNAADSYHFNMVKDRIKKGDYLYVQYGHNHKDTGGPPDYVSNLDKYYNLCKEKEAYLILVSPIERINTWNSTTKQYDYSHRDYAPAGEEYIKGKISNDGAKNVAFVDHNQYSLAFYNKIVKDNGDNANAIKYYFQTGKGGGTDATHPNDAGAENLAYEFIKAAQAVTDTTQKAVLDGFLNNITSETPNLIPASITSTPLGGDAWPTYIPPVQYAYPVVIKSVEFNEDGSVKQVDVVTQPSKIVMDSYGIIVITITGEDGKEKGKIYAKAQVDNSVGYGPQTITTFTTDVALAEGDTYSAIVMKAKEDGSNLVVDESNTVFSAVYKPTDIVEHLITDEDGEDGEDFDFFNAVYGGENASVLTSYNNWKHVGSGGANLTLGESDGVKYANMTNDGVNGQGAANKGSFYLHKDLTKAIGSTGKYMISADLKYLSGGGANIGFVKGLGSANWGTGSIIAFTVGSDGKVTSGGNEVGSISASAFTNVTYTLDMDLGKASISVGGSDSVEYDVENYTTLNADVNPDKLEAFWVDESNTAVGIQMANLVVAELKPSTLSEVTVTAATKDSSTGSVYIDTEGTTSKTVLMNDIVTLTAVPAEGYQLLAWKDEAGKDFAFTEECKVRAHKAVTLTAEFEPAEVDKYDYLYHETFKQLTTATMQADGWTSTNGSGYLSISNDNNPAIGNYFRFGGNDNSRGGTKAFGTTYTHEKGLAFGISAKLNKASADPNELAVHGGNITYNSNNINYGCTGGYVLYLNQANSGAITLNDKATDIPNDTWFNIIALCDFTAHTAKVKVTSLDGGTTYFDDTVDMADTAATGISGMYYKFGKSSGGAVSFDNIEIFPADQYVESTPAPATPTPAPETEAPETEAPETEAPETEAPATEAPETEAPETEAPETEAPETEAPETEAPETEAPATATPAPTATPVPTTPIPTTTPTPTTTPEATPTPTPTPAPIPEEIVPEVKAPTVTVDDSINEEDKETVTEAVEYLEVSGFEEAVQNLADKILVDDSETKSKLDEYKEANSDAEAVYVHTEITVDITAKAYNKTEKKYTVDVTPYYSLVVSTSKEDATENAKTIKDKTELNTSNVDVEIVIPVPADLAADGETVWVSHKHSDKKNVRSLVVNDGKVKFTNRNGFSEFEITAAKPDDVIEIAEVNGVIYESLQGAVDAVEDGGTIVLKSKDDLTAEVGYAKTFTVDISGVEDITADDLEITVGENYEITSNSVANGVKYTVTRKGANEPEITPAPTKKPSIGGGTTAHSSSGGTASTPKPTVKPTDKPEASAEPATSAQPSEATEIPKPTDAPSSDNTGDKPMTFADVNTGDWFYSDVEYAYANGLMNGVSDSEFGPSLNITRAMFVTILYRMDGEPAAGASAFSDVSSSAYYAGAVAWASANGIVTGYSDTEFAPDGNITREQMAAILYRYANYKGIDTSVSADITSYADAADVDDYAVTAMQWACGAGMMNGTGDKLEPLGTATRAQAAAVFGRFDKQYK